MVMTWNRTILEVASMVVTWWIMAVLRSGICRRYFSMSASQQDTPGLAAVMVNAIWSNLEASNVSMIMTDNT